MSHPTSRREFLKKSSALSAAALAIPAVHAAGSDIIKVGLIGCGGRGTGAAEQACNAGADVRLVALADMFQDHLDAKKKYLRDTLGEKFQVKDENCYVGFNAYLNVIKSDVDVVLLATPPHFRPLHLRAAIEAGKHVFAEKPMAVDGPGVRTVLAACAEARRKNLSVLSGFCWRYDTGMRETMKRLHDGAIGDIQALQCSYNTGALWMKPRKPEWSDMEWQLRNWLYFTWLSGDHNVEQHCHSLDKMAWAMKNEYPVRAVGLGGRQVRTGAEYGNIFDHHAVVYEYAGGQRLFSYCRQQQGTASDVSDHLWGTKGRCDIVASMPPRVKIEGANPWEYKPARQARGDMYQNEHNELFASIRAGKPMNDGEWMARSTLMAIMGRMATYTGQAITWEMAMNSKEDLTPPRYEFGPLSMPPVALPGVTKFA